MIHEDTFKKIDFDGAKGLVFIDEKILVYRRDNKTVYQPGRLDLPGGAREGDESPFETFQREIKEEFGVNIEEKDIQLSCRFNSVLKPGKKAFFIVAKCLETKPKDVIFGNEGIEWFLMTPEEFINRSDGIDRLQERVEKYLSGTLESE